MAPAVAGRADEERLDDVGEPRDAPNVLLSRVGGGYRMDVDLFRKYRRAEDYLSVPEEELQKDIQSTGFFRQKTRALRGMSQKLLTAIAPKGDRETTEAAGAERFGRLAGVLGGRSGQSVELAPRGLEAEAEIGGVRYVFTDTAGLRATDDAIEAEGVRRAETRLAQADLVIAVGCSLAYHAGGGGQLWRNASTLHIDIDPRALRQGQEVARHHLRADARLGVEALTAAFTSSFVGAFFSIVLITFFAPLLAEVALKFGPPEFFAIQLLTFSSFVGLGGGNPLKSLATILIGFMLSTVGLDIVTGQLRLTFGFTDLMKGFDFIVAVIGLFGVGEILYNLHKARQAVARSGQVFVVEGYTDVIGLDLFREICPELEEAGLGERYRREMLAGESRFEWDGSLASPGGELRLWMGLSSFAFRERSSS
mgnify:CR=1 FL=1